MFNKVKAFDLTIPANSNRVYFPDFFELRDKKINYIQFYNMSSYDNVPAYSHSSFLGTDGLVSLKKYNSSEYLVDKGSMDLFAPVFVFQNRMNTVNEKLDFPNCFIEFNQSTANIDQNVCVVVFYEDVIFSYTTEKMLFTSYLITKITGNKTYFYETDYLQNINLKYLMPVIMNDDGILINGLQTVVSDYITNSHLTIVDIYQNKVIDYMPVQAIWGGISGQLNLSQFMLDFNNIKVDWGKSWVEFSPAWDMSNYLDRGLMFNITGLKS
jgi:hypothetical protein